MKNTIQKIAIKTLNVTLAIIGAILFFAIVYVCIVYLGNLYPQCKC